MTKFANTFASVTVAKAAQRGTLLNFGRGLPLTIGDAPL
jgi:hypothetical protein